MPTTRPVAVRRLPPIIAQAFAIFLEVFVDSVSSVNVSVDKVSLVVISFFNFF